MDDIASIRPRNAEMTKEAILIAANRLFAERGYSAAGVRDIGAEAGVNSSLVRRYFGSKEGLFVAIMEKVLDPRPFVTGPREEFGRRAVDILMAGDQGPSPMATILLATGDPSARQLCSEMLWQRVFEPLSRWIGGPDGYAKASRLQIMWVGFATVRHILLLEDQRVAHLAATREWLEKATQAMID